MAAVAGVDFGTQSVRVSIVDSVDGRLGSAVVHYEVTRTADDPDWATQAHDAHLRALQEAMPAACADAGVSGEMVHALAVDTTGSTVLPLGEGMEPLDDYYLWCDHRAKAEAAEITRAAQVQGLEHIKWCGGVYSSEWGWAKLLHWLRHNPEKRGQLAAAMEHCDVVAAVLCGETDPRRVKRSLCAAGHKWLLQPDLGGLPSADFLASVDPLLGAARDAVAGPFASSRELAGALCAEWAGKLGLRSGIPMPVGAIDAHWDAIGAGIREGDVVNVVGTSSCIMAIARETGLIPGVCGVVHGSIHPDYFGIEAGLSAAGDMFEAIATRAGCSVAALVEQCADYRAGQTGLLRLAWDNGDRTVLVNPHLGGCTFGWTLTSTAADELYAAIEGTAMHTRVILERMQAHGVPVNRLINAGGIPQKNETLNQVYANMLGLPILIPTEAVTSLGSAIFAMLAAGIYDTIEDAQAVLAPDYRVVEPDADARSACDELYSLFQALYFSLGQPASEPAAVGGILPALRNLAARQRG